MAYLFLSSRFSEKDIFKFCIFVFSLIVQNLTSGAVNDTEGTVDPRPNME